MPMVVTLVVHCLKCTLVVPLNRPKVSIIGSREQLCINSDVLKQDNNSAKVRKAKQFK